MLAKSALSRKAVSQKTKPTKHKGCGSQGTTPEVHPDTDTDIHRHTPISSILRFFRKDTVKAGEMSLECSSLCGILIVLTARTVRSVSPK